MTSSSHHATYRASTTHDPTPVIVLRLNPLLMLQLKLLEDIVLRVDACGLTHLPSPILQKHQLRELHLSHNTLISLPPGIGSLAHLRVLTLDHNLLASLPPELGQLAHLQALDCCSNMLESVPLELGLLLQLTQFNLFENPLTALLQPSASGSPDSPCIPDPAATPRQHVRGARASGGSASRPTPEGRTSNDTDGEGVTADTVEGDSGEDMGAAREGGMPSPSTFDPGSMEGGQSSSVPPTSSSYSATTVTTATLRTFEAAYFGALAGGRRPKLAAATSKAQLQMHTGLVLAALRGCMPLAQGKGMRDAVGSCRRVAVAGREKLMKLAGVGELAVVEKAVAAAVAANVQVADLAVAVLALELLQDLKAATAGTDSRRLRRSIEAWEAFAAPLSGRPTGVDHSLAKSALRRLRRADLSKGWRLTESAYSPSPAPAPLLDPEAAAAAATSAVGAAAAEADPAAAAAAGAVARDAAWRGEGEAAEAAREGRCSGSPHDPATPPLPAPAHTGGSGSGGRDAWGAVWEGSEEGGQQGGGGTSAGRSRGGMKSDGVVCRRGAGAQVGQALRSYTKWVEEKRALGATKKAELLAFQARLTEAGRLDKLTRGQDRERLRHLEQGWPSRHTCPYKHGTFTDTARLEFTRQGPPRPSSAPLSASPLGQCGPGERRGADALDGLTPLTGRPHTALPYRRDVATPGPSTQRSPPRHTAPPPPPRPPLGHTMGPPTKNRVRATTAPSMRTPLITPTHPTRGTGGSPIPVTARELDFGRPMTSPSDHLGAGRPVTSAGPRPRPGSLVIPTGCRIPANAVGLEGTARPPVSRSNGSGGSGAQYGGAVTLGPPSLPRPGCGILSLARMNPPLESVAESGTGGSPTMAWGAMPSPQSATLGGAVSRRCIRMPGHEQHAAGPQGTSGGGDDYGGGGGGGTGPSRGPLSDGPVQGSGASMDGRPTTSHQGGGSRGAVVHPAQQQQQQQQQQQLSAGEQWGRKRLLEGGPAAAAAVVASGRADAAIAAAMVAIAAASPRPRATSSPGAADISSPRREHSRRTDFSPTPATTPPAAGPLPYVRESTASVESAAGRAALPAQVVAGVRRSTHPVSHLLSPGSRRTGGAAPAADEAGSDADSGPRRSSGAGWAHAPGLDLDKVGSRSSAAGGAGPEPLGDRSVRRSGATRREPPSAGGALPTPSPAAPGFDTTRVTAKAVSSPQPPQPAGHVASTTPSAPATARDSPRTGAPATADDSSQDPLPAAASSAASPVAPQYSSINPTATSVAEWAAAAASVLTADSRAQARQMPTSPGPPEYSVSEEHAVSPPPSAAVPASVAAREPVARRRTVTPPQVPAPSTPDYSVDEEYSALGSSGAASVATCASGDGTAATASCAAAPTATPATSVEEQSVTETAATAATTQAPAPAVGSVRDGAAAAPASLAASASPEYSMDDDGSLHASSAARSEPPDDGLITEGEADSEEEEISADDGVSEGFEGEEGEEGDEIVDESDGGSGHTGEDAAEFVGGDPGPEGPLGGDVVGDVGSDYGFEEEVEPDPAGQEQEGGEVDEAEAYSGGDFID
ncbi:MAG: hypothetical protein WDW36_003592 [Sanguina aurantia]